MGSSKVGLEKNPHDRDALAGVFRTIHTIKGTCGFLGFNKLEKVANVGENLRNGQLTLNPERTTALLGVHKLEGRLMHVLGIEKACQMADGAEAAAGR